MNTSILGRIIGSGIMLTSDDPSDPAATGIMIHSRERSAGIYHWGSDSLYLGRVPNPDETHPMNNIIIATDTESSEVGTGALTVAGGVGIAKNITAGANVSILGETDSASAITGALIVAGGVGIAKTITVGADAHILGATASTTTATGALTVAGGVGVGGAMFVGGALTAASFESSTTMVSAELAIDAAVSCLPAGNITVELRKAAGIVAFRLVKITENTTSENPIITSGTLPDGYHPVDDIVLPCIMREGQTQSVGDVIIRRGGTIEIYQAGLESFGTGVPIQVSSISTSYPVA